MRKLLFAVLLTLSMNAVSMSASGVRHTTKCINGYVFLFTWSGNSNDAPNVVQIFESTMVQTSPPQPVACRIK